MISTNRRLVERIASAATGIPIPHKQYFAVALETNPRLNVPESCAVC